MAFARTGPARMPLVDIYVAGLSGEIAVVGSPRRLLAGQAAPVSLEWTPDGRTLVFSSGGRLWRMSADAGGASVPEPLTFATGYVMGLALSRDGRRLVYSQRQLRQNIRRVELTGLGMAASAPGELFPSTREDSWPQYAPDGSRVAFLSDRSGTRQIYVCDADGSNPRRLTALAGGVERPYPGWSPDGRQIVFAASVAGRTDLYVIDARGGAPSRLSYDPSSEYHPQWSRDGKWIYFGSDRNGESEVWKMPSAGGEAVRVTEHGGEGPFESPDGRHLYYFKAGAAGAEQLWRRLLPGGDEHLVLPEVFRGNFAMAGEYVYFVPQQDVGCGCYHLQRLDTTTGEVATLMALNEVGGGLSVSSDGRSLLYTTVLHTNADLMLVDGVR